MDFSSSSISMSPDVFSSANTFAGGVDWEAELRRRSLPSSADDVEMRRL